MKHSFLSIIAVTALAISPSMAAESAAADQSTATAVTPAAKVVAEVSAKVKASPDKAAEIVKDTIRKTNADAELVAEIVAAAVKAAPEQIEQISKMAMAVAPDAFGHVAIALAKLDGYDMDEVGLGGQDPLDAPGDREALAAFLNQVATGEVSNPQAALRGRGLSGGFISKFITAVVNPRHQGPSIRFPLAFDMPMGFNTGFNNEIVTVTYDDQGRTTGIIIDTSPTAPSNL